ncbi:MAG TPA: FAD-binding oxidoreductase [Gemmatimonadaceae bacterium]
MGTDRIGPADPRYRAVVDKRFNKRFSASPDYVRLVSSASDVVAAVQDAVNEGRRLVVTSGGHCLEGFVADPTVKVIIDVSPMKRVFYDRKLRAIAVEAGATVGDTFRVLSDRWGTVVPLGEHPAIGIGGHVAGGAFGFLCRQLGLAADYLYAVEVVTVDENGRATIVVATREADDPNRELWWAHTGGGAGSFGVMTRCWFRSRDASGEDPSAILPHAPNTIATYRAEWSWSDIDRERFVRLARNFGEWVERNSGASSANASMWCLLELHRKQFGIIVIRAVSTAGDAARRQIDAIIDAVSEGIGPPRNPAFDEIPWAVFAVNPLPDMFSMPPGGVSVKVKDALLCKRFTDVQMSVAYDHLTSTDHDIMGGMLGLMSYGGRVNTIASDATASAQRSAIFDTACNTGWIDPGDEERNLKWVRGFYSALFADSGGVPAPDDRYDGALINHPDSDLADPAFNTSAVVWHELYYKQNYSRLQRVKARWDPRNIFHHPLSIRV